MASATITALLTPSLYKVSASAGAFALALAPAPAPAPGFRTPRAISIGSLQPKSNAKSSATSTTLPTPLRSASFMWGYLPTCQADKIGGRRPSSPIQCSRIDFVNSTEALRWLFVISSVILMLSKNTSIHKSFLVPLLALEAPTDVVSWIRGDYGLWTAFVVFLVRLFYPIPGEMELPLLFVLLVIIAPFQALNVRGTQAGMVISIAIAAFLSYQHLSRSGGLKEAFEQRSIVASIAALFLICVPLCFLIQGFMF